MNAIPVTSMSALCVRRSATAIMDMIWNIVVIIMTTIVNVARKEMNHARH